MYDVRYWVAGNQAFGYTPHRQPDGKFRALKYKYNSKKGRGSLIKERVFGRRKKAKETAYRWFIERKAVLEKLRAARPVKVAPTKAEILQKKISKADANIKRHEKRLKLLKTLIKKWERRKKSWQRQINQLPVKKLFFWGESVQTALADFKEMKEVVTDYEKLRDEYRLFRDSLKRNYVDKTIQLRLTDFFPSFGVYVCILLNCGCSRNSATNTNWIIRKSTIH